MPQIYYISCRADEAGDIWERTSRYAGEPHCHVWRTEAEEAVKLCEKANPDIEAAIASIKVGQEFSAPRNNMYDHIGE